MAERLESNLILAEWKMFFQFFGGGASGFGNSRGQTSDRGNDLEVELELDFDDAIRGIEKTFSSKTSRTL